MLWYWRWIPGFRGYYKVSSRGRVKSVDRYTKHWRGGVTLRKGKLLKQTFDSDGYKFVSLSKNGKSYPYRVHVLVLTAFTGPCPTGMEARHLDGKSWNNKRTNLRWGTRFANAQDRIKHGTNRGGRRKLSDTDKEKIRRYIQDAEIGQKWKASKEMANRFDMSPNYLYSSIWKRAV